MENAPVNPQLVEKLTTILEQAKRGELVGFAALTFREKGDPDQWAFITRHEDMNRLAGELEALKDWQNN